MIIVMMDIIVFAIVGQRVAMVKTIFAGVVIFLETAAEGLFRMFLRFRGLRTVFFLIVVQVGCCCST